MKTITVLFDLDDTLLQTNGRAFLPFYFKALSENLSFLAPEEKIVQQILYAVQEMKENQNPGRTLKKTFGENFYGPLGTTEESCKQIIERFYKTEYPKLERRVAKKPSAKPLIDWCHSQNIQTAITTDPLFPAMATCQRIKWAGLDIDDFVFFTAYEDFHFTKPNLTYYAEVIGRLGWPDHPVIIVGDNIDHDLKPMETLGYPGFLIDPDFQDPGQPHGALSDTQQFLESFIMNLELPKLNSDPSVLMAILRSMPAVLDSWIRQVPEPKPNNAFSNQDLNCLDIIAHLNLRERKVFLPTLQNITGRSRSFKNSFRAVEKQKPLKYQGPINLTGLFSQFLENRKQSLDLLNGYFEKNYNEELLNIAGPSQVRNFNFIKDYVEQDRYWLHQYFALLNI